MLAVNYVKHAMLGKIQTWLVWVLAITLLILSGIGYRLFASRLKFALDTPISLPVPLSAFPTQIGNWEGKDVPIPQNIQRAARVDDFLSRFYVHKTTNQWANVYIPYTARPRAMLGHRPQVCYPAVGWIHDGTEHTKIISKSGRDIPCLLHRFHRPGVNHEERVVLNFYIVNGQITTDENVFTGIGWRTPNIAGKPARYVAQVQIISVLENSVRTAAKDMAGLILDYLPDENGEVRATEFHNTTSSVLK